MAYVKTNWVDDVTPISATNMNKIETALESDDLRVSTLELSGYVAGFYTGNGALDRIISLGFTPKAVLVMEKGSAVYNYNSIINGGLAVTDSPVKNRSNNNDALGMEVVTNGFKVYQTSANAVQLNTSAVYYNYIAFK